MLFKLSNSYKSLTIAILSFTLFTSNKAEYLVYKMVDGKAQPISQESEYKKVYTELMRFQFPMNANSSLNLGKELSKKELRSLDKDEQAFLESRLQKKIDKNLKLLWLPTTVFEHFAINYFLCTSEKSDGQSILSELQTFKYDSSHEEAFKHMYERLNGIMGEIMSQGGTPEEIQATLKTEAIQTKLRTFIPETKKILADNGLQFAHCGYPLNYDPVCKATRQEYEVASNVMNNLEIFQRTYFAVNHKLFEFLNDNGCRLNGKDRSIDKNVASSLLNKMISDLKQVIVCQDKDEATPADPEAYVDEFANYQTPNDYVKFIQEVDVNLAESFDKILDVEFEAKKANSFVLYRATNGIGEKLDSPVKYDEETKTAEPYWLSYGRGIYASSLCDKGACASNWIKDSKFFYALLIDKATYRQNVSSNVANNIFHIQPYNTIISLIGNGNYCHPRACSFAPAELPNMSDDQMKNYSMETLQAMLVRPPLFVGLFSTNITPEACEKRFADYCNDKHVRMIVSGEAN